MSDRHYRWVVVLFSLVIQAVSVGILVYCFALFVLPWLDEFSTSRADVMVTISCLQIGMGVLGPPVGRLMDRFAMRNIVLAGAACLALGLWLVQFCTAVWQLWLLYATLMPLGMALMGTLASQTLVAKWFVEQRGLALGLSAMGTNVGGMIFPLIVAGWLLDVGWRQTFAWLAVTSLVIVVPLTFLVLARKPPVSEYTGQSGPGNLLNQRIWTTREILTTSLFWLPFVCLVPLNMAFGAVQFNLGVFAADAGLPGDAAAVLITVSSVCMLGGKLFFGSLGDRVDHRYLFWVASVLVCASLLLFLFTSGYPGLLAGVMFMGLAGGGILPMMGLIFGARFGAASFGRVMGFVMLNVLLGALAPVFAGAAYDAFASYDVALWGFLALAVPAALAMYRLPRPPD